MICMFVMDFSKRNNDDPYYNVVDFEEMREHRRKSQPERPPSEDDKYILDLSFTYFMTQLPAIDFHFGRIFDQAASGLGEEAATHKAALLEYMQATTQETKDARADGFDALVQRMLTAKRQRLGAHHT